MFPVTKQSTLAVPRSTKIEPVFILFQGTNRGQTD